VTGLDHHGFASFLVLLHAAATLLMTGVIWFVQIVHYPLLARVGRPDFAGYERAHTRRITPVVGPIMICEGALAVALALRPPAGGADWLVWLGLALLVVIWASTAVLQVPCHRILAEGFDGRTHTRLVRSNWIRTATWTARAGLALWLAFTSVTTGV